MADIRPGTGTATLYAFFTAEKVGKGGIGVTVDYRKADGTLVTGIAATPDLDLEGYFYLAGVDASAGAIKAVFKTTDATVDQQHLPGLMLVGDADLEAAAVTISTLVADVWAYGTRTLTSFGTLVADVATAVWAAGTRTLTSFGTLVADAAAASATAVWAAGSRTLTSLGTAVADITAAVLAGLATTIAQVAATYTKVIAPGAVQVVSPGPDDAGVITVVIGDAYDEDHGNAIEIPIPNAPDVSAATLAFTVEGVTLSPAVTATVTGAGDARVAVVELSAAHTTQLDALPLGFPRLNRTYWRVRSTWAESPTKPQTIAYGEIRRPVWDQA